MKIFKSLMVLAALASACTTTDGDTTSSSSSSSSSGGGGNVCATRPGNHTADDSSTLTKATVDATMPPTLTSGMALNDQKFCGNTDQNVYWWKLPGMHAANSTFHLVVTFDRGSEADDVDFDVVYFDADGMGYTNIASCSAGSGTNEDCMGTITEAVTDVYVQAAIGNTMAAEQFDITLTKM